MVSGKKMKIHAAGTKSYTEERFVDTAELRLAEIDARTEASTIGVLRDRLIKSFEEFGITDEAGSMQVCMALEEALANAFYHGNLELDSALKEDGSSLFADTAKERCGLSPWKDRTIKIYELATPFGIWLTIRDEGRGFNVAAALRRTEDPMSLLASGRGLVMMKAFTDDLLFNKVGNEVTLVIYSKRNSDITELLQERARSRHLETGKRSLI